MLQRAIDERADFAFETTLGGKTITANEIDNFLQSSTDLTERQAVWEASKQSGPALKAGLVQLRDLRKGFHLMRRQKVPR